MGLLILILLCIIFSPAWATDYYVSQAGAGAANGTSAENAWAGWGNINWDTDGAGADTGVGAGDTLYVIGTLRRDTFPVNGYGLSEAQRVTIASDLSTAGELWVGVEFASGSWVGPDAFGAYSQAVGADTNAIYAAEWSAADSPWPGVTLTKKSGVPDGTWGNGSWYNDGATTVYYKPSVPGTVRTVTGHAATSRVFSISGESYITISGLILNSGNAISTGSSYFTFSGNTVYCVGTHDVHALGIGSEGTAPSHYAVVSGNIFRDCKLGISVNNQTNNDTYNNNYITIQGNTIYNMNQDQDSHAIGIQGGIGHIVANNTIYNVGTGITFWNQATQTMQNNTVKYNFIYHVGYYSDPTAPEYIAGDNGNGRGIEFSGETGDSDLTTGNVIYGNIINGCYRAAGGDPDGVGIRIKNGIPTTGYSIKAFNNTVRDCYSNFYLMPTGNEGYEVGAYLYNNISLSPKSGGTHITVQTNGVTYDLDINYNLYYPDGAALFAYEGATYNLAGWKAAVSEDANSVLGDPQLSNAGGSYALATDFMPWVFGAGVGQGADLGSTYATDYAGVTQGSLGGTWDIGAYYVAPVGKRYGTVTLGAP